MRHALLANRYARALQAVASENHEQDKVIEPMRALDEAFHDGGDIEEFLFSPVVRPQDKVVALQQMMDKVAFPESLRNFVLLLAKKNRLRIFKDILQAYQHLADENHGVTRGVVRSATVLAPEERKRIESLVSRKTGKQVILSYKEDPELLGGLIAEVGSFTFDDSLTSHLKRINEQLTRSSH
jgi:F-type H+-transporting ATPase subunit delta